MTTETIVVITPDTDAGTYTGNLIQGDTNSNNLPGTIGNDIIVGNGGADTIIGGAGDDILIGGHLDLITNGAHEGDYNITEAGGDPPPGDLFVFNFDVTQGTTETFSQFLTNAGFGGSLDNGDLADGTTQSFFAVEYTAWVNHLVQTYDLGTDLNADGKIDVSINQNDPLGVPSIEGMSAEDLQALFSDSDSFLAQTGHTTQERYYADAFSTGASSVSSTDGHDTVLDFQLGTDHVQLTNVTQAIFNQNFTVSQTDTNGDGHLDTVIALNDSSWSVTLLGITDPTTTDAGQALKDWAWNDLVHHA